MIVAATSPWELYVNGHSNFCLNLQTEGLTLKGTRCPSHCSVMLTLEPSDGVKDNITNNLQDRSEHTRRKCVHE